MPAHGVSDVKLKPSYSRVWLIPLAAALVVGLVGWLSQRTLESSLKHDLKQELHALLAADVTALRMWMGIQKSVAEAYAAEPRIQQTIGDLVEISEQNPNAHIPLRDSPSLTQLRRILAPVIREHQYLGFAAVDRNGIVVARATDEGIGHRSPVSPHYLSEIFKEETIVSKPFPASEVVIEGAEGYQANQPLMFVGTPVRDPEGKIIAAFGFGIDPHSEFTAILQVAQMGDSGETYAFDADAVLVSESRFEDQLRATGLLPDDPSVSSILNIQVRDPGGNMTEGFVPNLPLQARPLTRMAAAAVTGSDGVDVDGYRDYRGVPVVGAWTWIPELDIGVTTEVDVGQAYGNLTGVQHLLWALIGLLLLGALSMFFYSNVVVRLRQRVEEAQQLGQYRLEQKIGEGGMGKVFRARHAFLCRPTAIKLLRAEHDNEEAVKRFEREVQYTSRLTHPNTVAIYDYGHTPSGRFYYAMEYLQGITLERCIEESGPQPEPRVVYIMKQACGSIAEAHAAGMIHRDIKPSNIMLCERGGLFDFVKVLDFGLVRSTEPTSTQITRFEMLTGTPLYLSPEAITDPESLDARGDVYQLGAIAYYALTGQHVFKGSTVLEVAGHHLNEQPIPPSTRLEKPVSQDLEDLIMQCLEKDPSNRHATAFELLQALESCEVQGIWGQRDARTWWQKWLESHQILDFDEVPSTQKGMSTSEATELPVDIEEHRRERAGRHDEQQTP